MSVIITRDIQNILLMICRGGANKIFFKTEYESSTPMKASSPEMDGKAEADLRRGLFDRRRPRKTVLFSGKNRLTGEQRANPKIRKQYKKFLIFQVLKFSKSEGTLR